MLPPQPSRASHEYNVDLSKAFAELAQAATCGVTDFLQDFHCETCQQVGFDLAPGTVRFATFSDYESWDSNTSFAYVARLQNTSSGDDMGCLLSIRGSVNLVNYVSDATFWHKNMTGLPDADLCPGCLLHSGFASVWESLEGNVTKAFNELGCQPDAEDPNLRKLYITGHSLGAAAGTYAMFQYQTHGYEVQQGYLFESPRLGNKKFAESFYRAFGDKIPMFRVSTRRDPVVHLPPQGGYAYLPEYTHVSSEVYYLPSHHEDEYIVCEHAEDTLCAERYSLMDGVLYGDDHCKLPLVANGDICHLEACGSLLV